MPFIDLARKTLKSDFKYDLVSRTVPVRQVKRNRRGAGRGEVHLPHTDEQPTTCLLYHPELTLLQCSCLFRQLQEGIESTIDAHVLRVRIFALFA